MTNEIVNLTLDDAIKLGVKFQQQNEHEKAIAVYQQILEAAPDTISVISNLAVSLMHVGQLEAGIQYFIKVTEVAPSGDAFMNLASALMQVNNFPLVFKSYIHALAYFPEHSKLHENLCNLLMQQGDNLIDLLPSAIQALEQLLKKVPQAKHLNIELALMHQKLFNLDQAIEYYKKLPKLGIKSVELYNQLGLAYLFKNQPVDAESPFLQAVKLNPTFISPYINLGICYEMLSKHQKSIEYNLKAIEIDPTDIKPYNNLANLYKNKTMINESLYHYRKVLEIQPNHATAYSNFLLSLHYHTYDKKEVFEEHQKFEKACTSRNPPISYLNTCEERKLRIGYLSPDFKKHSVAFFIEPIIENHDRDKFEVYCYYLQKVEDSFTKRFIELADKWVVAANLSTPGLAQEIYNDKIDILIDLSGHTGNNRLPLFAYKPAPIQITYLGYPDTTGLSTIDYRIVDNYVEPEEEGDLYTTEKLLRMSHSYFCYTPIEKCPVTGDTPALKNGYITFGSFNNYAKVSDVIVDVWAAVLKAIPTSKFLLKNQALKDPDTWEHFKTRMAERGVDTHRLQYSKFAKSTQDHLRVYQKVDIALDSFPYNGATTTFEALWMGVPVITLVGDTHVSRVGKSILATLGFDNLIAHTPDEFVTICQTLANDVNYLQNFRQTIREKMQNSPVMDAKTFTRELEELYQRVWKNWCENRTNQHEQFFEQFSQTSSQNAIKKIFFGLRHHKPDYCM
jgi:protein O-GlcNAc transferase